MGLNVEMSDPQWPSLREAARRFLKVEGCELSVPKDFAKQAWDLVQSISDNIPSRLSLPNVIEGDFMVEGLFQLGGEEPSLEICWVPDCSWDDFSEQVMELLECNIRSVIFKNERQGLCALAGARGEGPSAACHLRRGAVSRFSRLHGGYRRCGEPEGEEDAEAEPVAHP